MGEEARLLQHWKGKRGGRECGVFLFTDGIAIVPRGLPREQELLQAINSSPTASPQTILGARSWWFPFSTVRRILIQREKFMFTVESAAGTASAFLSSMDDVDYMLELMRDFCKSVVWKESEARKRLGHDSLRLLLLALVLASLFVCAAFAVNILDARADTTHLVGLMKKFNDSGKSPWIALVAPGTVSFILLIITVVLGIASPKYKILEPAT